MPNFKPLPFHKKQCECGVILGNDVDRCPICEGKPIFLLPAETKAQRLARGEFQRNQKLSMELKRPYLPLYNPAKTERGWKFRGRKITMRTIKEFENGEE